MVGFRIELEDEVLRKALVGLQARGEDLRLLLDGIGTVVARNSQERFDKGAGPGGTPWKPSLRALETGNKTLVLSAALKNNIQQYLIGDDTVEIGPSVGIAYAAIHQFGGKAGRGHASLIPARPYLGIDENDKDDIFGIIENHLRSAL